MKMKSKSEDANNIFNYRQPPVNSEVVDDIIKFIDSEIKTIKDIKLDVDIDSDKSLKEITSVIAQRSVRSVLLERAFTLKGVLVTLSKYLDDLDNTWEAAKDGTGGQF